MVSPFRFPRPRSCLKIISLRTATEFINLTLLINKVTGFYGILAIFTGYALDPLQLSHYAYSLLILTLVASLLPSLRDPQAPLKNLALAWVYVLDTLVNGAYTVLFSAGWFLLLAQHLRERVALMPRTLVDAAKGTMGDTAGFTDPEFNASRVEVLATPAPGLLSGQHAVAYASGEGATNLGGLIWQSDSLTSVVLLAGLFAVRVYFCFVVLAYARGMLRQYVALNSAAAGTGYADSADPTMAESPFAVDKEKGAGWAGWLGRAMVSLPSKRYWLGREEPDHEEWASRSSARYDAIVGGGHNGINALKIKVPDTGLGERERRARSGTGPPPPLQQGTGKKVPE